MTDVAHIIITAKARSIAYNSLTYQCKYKHNILVDFNLLEFIYFVFTCTSGVVMAGGSGLCGCP